ncbi:MAG: helix-turn-helix transcriptional regulator [Ignavibacteriae bacterium]|nr:helix-turn-helix transcriptional regulator [Ignavibacteriota bacterium]
MDVVTVIILLGIVQGFILGTILLTIRRGNKNANRVLGILIILFSYMLSPAFLINVDLYKILPHLMMTAHPVLFLFGPLFLLYVIILISKVFKFNKIFLLHFIPFLLNVIYLMPFYIESVEEKLRVLEEGGTGTDVVDYLITISMLVHVITYIVIVYSTVKKHTKNLMDSFSSIDKINLQWIQNIIKWFLVVVAVMTVNVILYIIGYENFVDTYTGIIVPVLIVIIIYSIGYRGLFQPEIFTGEIEEQKKYKKTFLESAKAEKYIENLISYMKSEKPYFKNDLTLKSLSEMSAIPYYHLSRIINENLKQNFFDFVNRYRIEEAKSRLLDPKFDHYSIFGIAQEVGFHSKSAFNIAFKKYTNKTPSQFRSR